MTDDDKGEANAPISPGTPVKPVVARDERGRLLPGAKLASPGRPLSLARYIASQTDDGKEIVDRMISIWNGEVPGFKPREILEAGKWVADRFWGKAIDIQAIATLDGGAAPETLQLAGDALMKLAQALHNKAIPPKTITIEAELPSGSAVVADPTPSPNYEQSPTVKKQG